MRLALVLAFALAACAAENAARTPTPMEEDEPVLTPRADARPVSSDAATAAPEVTRPDAALPADAPPIADAALAPDIAPRDAAAGDAGSAAPRLELMWTRLADPAGKADTDPDTASAESAEFSPDGRLIATGSKGVPQGSARRGQRISVWRVEDGTMLWERPRANEVEAVSFSPDGKVIAAGGEDMITEILDPADGRLITTLRTNASIDGLRFSRDGKWLAVGTEAQLILLYRTSDWKLVTSTHHGGSGQNAVNQIDFTSDDKLLVSAGTNGQVKVWQFDTATAVLRLQRTVTLPATVKAVRISADDRLFAAGVGHAAGTFVHELATGRRVAHMPATAQTQECLEFTPDSRYLLTGGSEGTNRVDPPYAKQFPPNGGFGFIRFFRVPQDLNQPFPLVTSHPSFRQEYYDFTKDGRLLVSSHEDGTIRLWRVTLP